MKLDKTRGAWLINFCLGFAGRAQLKKLRKAAKDCKKTQSATLRKILEYAKNTEWGKSHNFEEILSASTDEELYSLWKKNVPPAEYEDFRPFIERHKNGEENILFPGKPKMYATTSGTTNKPKWIAITDAYYSNVYSKMTKLWLYTFMMHRPKVFEGRAVSIVGKAIETEAPDGTLCGSVSGVTRRDCPEFISKLHSAPHCTFDIENYDARYYSIIRIALEQNVTLIITPNPSSILEMQKNIQQNFDRCVEDIEKGTLDKSLEIEPSIRMELESTLKPNPKRAEQLRQLKKNGVDLIPKNYWPNMTALTTWKCGNTKVYMNKFAGSFPDEMLYQEFSYFSSECRAGLVMNGKDDTVLFPHMHFFEFVEESEIESPNPKFLQTSELEVGKRYSIYVTTFAGLYRYCMNDLLEVTGMYNTIPTVQFIQKINGIISMTGEKLHETQLIDAVQKTQDALNRETKFYICFADVQNSVYHFYVEYENNELSQNELDEFAELLDKNLRVENCEYDAKRDSKRIGRIIPHLLKENSLQLFKEFSLDAGLGRDGQFKFNILMQNEKTHNLIKKVEKI